MLQRFEGLKASKSTVCELMWTHCNLSLKMPWFQSVDRHSEGKIHECLDLVGEWEGRVWISGPTASSWMSLRSASTRSAVSWCKKGSPAVVAVLKSWAQTAIILGVLLPDQWRAAWIAIAASQEEKARGLCCVHDSQFLSTVYGAFREPYSQLLVSVAWIGDLPQ